MRKVEQRTREFDERIVCVLAAVVLLVAPVDVVSGQKSHVFVASDFEISDSTEASMIISAPGVQGVAFSTSIYGYGGLPGVSLLVDFENAYRDLRRVVAERRRIAFADLTRDADSAAYELSFARFRQRPENMLAFAPPPDSSGLARQYYREMVDSTDYMYVHFFSVEDAVTRGGRAWTNVNLFLEGGGPSTHFVRFDVRKRQIDRVTVNWYD